MSCDCNTLVVGEAGPQGPQGLAGTNGTNGTNGINAFTTLTTQFTQPSVGGSITIVVGNNQWIASGQAIYISAAGFYTATSFSGTTSVVCDLVKTDGVSPGNTVSSGRKISPAAIATYAAPLSSLTVNGDSALDGSVIINDSGADKDVRIEGDTDTNLFRTDASTDKVGIGIAVPETKLHVAGGFKVGTGASGADALFSQAATFNNNQASSGDFSVKSVNLDPVLFVDASADRVGIGTNSPSKLLDVAGAMEANTVLVNPGGISGTEVFKVLGTSSAVPLVVDATNNRVGIKTASPTVELDVTGAAKISGNLAVDTDVLFVDTATNRVGINDSTPSYSLDVNGTANVTSTLGVGGNTTLGGTLNVTGTSTLAGANASGSVSVGGDLTVDTNVLFASATNNFVGVNTTTPITDAALIVSGGDLVVDTNALFVDASANRVGINTSTPAQALDVSGAISVSGNIVVDTDSFVVNAGTSQVAIGTATFISGAALTVAGGDVDISGGLVVDTDTLFVDESNNRVGIKTTVPDVPLHVNGAVQATSFQVEPSAGKITKIYFANGNSNALAGLASGDSESFEDTVTGAQVGDFVISSLNTVPATTDFKTDVVFSTKVTDLDKVHVTFTNTNASGNSNTFTNTVTLRHLVIRGAQS